jgi:hypothetical protein
MELRLIWTLQGNGSLLSLDWTLELVALPGEEKTIAPLVLAPGRRAIDLVYRELRK